MIHVIVMDSFIPLFRGGKPLEVMEIWFTGPHCLFSTHINYNRNQKRLRLPFLMFSYTFLFYVCTVLFCGVLGFRSPWVCEPWHFQHLINAFMQTWCTRKYGQIYIDIYESTHSHNKSHSVQRGAVLNL